MADLKPKKATIQKLEVMRSELREIRQAALEASRTGDALRAARLSAQAVKLNKAILEAEGLANFA